MKKINAVILFICLCALQLSGQKNNREVEALLNTDREFSEFSVRQGMNRAFYEYADESIVLLKPDRMPLKGMEAMKDYHSAIADSTFTLSWTPDYARVAKGGDLGYTYGTWKISGETGNSEGSYVSIWSKNKDGKWKLVLDTGNSGLGNDTQTDNMENKKKSQVTGIGGIFFKCKDTRAVKEWYAKHLGFKTDEYGAPFVYREYDNPETRAYLQWSPFPEKTEYFMPSEKEFMINYRVRDLEKLVKNLREEGVVILDEIAVYDYGKFVHILDIENNKIELWEPVDEVFDEYYKEKE